MAKSILRTIESRMDTFSKGQKRIARYILEHCDAAAFLTASKLGEMTQVSESTVVRFAMELGCSGYPAMQRALQESLSSRLTSTQRLQAADHQLSGPDLLGTVVHLDMEKLRAVATQADRAQFDSAVERIIHARQVYVVGGRSSFFVAGYLYFYMHLLFDNVTLVRSDEATFEQLFRISPEDVMIAISFPRYSQVTVKTVKFAHDRGASIIAVTDNALSPVCQCSDAPLLIPCEMISFVDSMVAPLSLMNALLVALAHRLGTDVSNTFTRLEKIWNDYGVFGELDDE